MKTSKKIARAVSAALCLMLLLASIPALADTYATVQGGTLNLRQKASTSAKVLGQYPTGTWVSILEQGDTWCKVSVDGKTGYMKTKYLTSAGKNTMYVRTNTGVGLNLRTAPSMSGEIITSFQPGTAVTVLKKGGGWYYVSVAGLKGYMGSQYLSASAGKSSSGNDSSPIKSYSSKLFNPNGGSIVNFRSGPSLNKSVIAAYPVGTSVTVLSKENNWCKVEINGQTGYVSAYFLKP
ncbi:MAG: SH3 domain-containing protein [Clostridia bacterium]|nr:SH3 domain-containing protein [Clostridia bacterium]